MTEKVAVCGCGARGGFMVGIRQPRCLACAFRECRSERDRRHLLNTYANARGQDGRGREPLPELLALPLETSSS